MRNSNSFGKSNSETFKSKHNIAFSNRTLGKYVESLQMFRELYSERKDIFGENHPATILTSQNVASLSLDPGKHSEALKIYLNILDIEKKILVENLEYYPKTLKTTFYIACTY